MVITSIPSVYCRDVINIKNHGIENRRDIFPLNNDKWFFMMNIWKKPSPNLSLYSQPFKYFNTFSQEMLKGEKILVVSTSYMIKLLSTFFPFFANKIEALCSNKRGNSATILNLPRFYIVIEFRCFLELTVWCERNLMKWRHILSH